MIAKLCLSSDSLLRMSISSTQHPGLPVDVHLVGRFGCGMSLDGLPVLDAGLLLRRLRRAAARRRAAPADRRRRRWRRSRRLLLVGEQVLERVGVVAPLGEQAVQDLDVLAEVGELLLLRDRRVIDLDVEGDLPLHLEDEPDARRTRCAGRADRPPPARSPTRSPTARRAPSAPCRRAPCGRTRAAAPAAPCGGAAWSSCRGTSPTRRARGT